MWPQQLLSMATMERQTGETFPCYCCKRNWYKGIMTEKNENDEATLTVLFPTRGETFAISTQQLRSSHIWTNGNWVQWSRVRGHECSSEDDELTIFDVRKFKSIHQRKFNYEVKRVHGT